MTDWAPALRCLQSLRDAPGCECSDCDNTYPMRMIRYRFESGGHGIGKPYMMVRTVCRKCVAARSVPGLYTYAKACAVAARREE